MSDYEHTEDTYDEAHDREAPNRPADVLRDGALKASIWRNESDKGPFFSTVLAKTYEDRNGNLRDTHSFSGTDLLRVSELARQAYTRSTDLRREAAQEYSRNDGQDSREDRKAVFKQQRSNGHDNRSSRER